MFKRNMRSTERYTVPEDVVELPDLEQYAAAYRELPLVRRILLWFRVWLGGQSLPAVLQEMEKQRLLHKMQRTYPDIIDTGNLMLLAGFYEPLREVSRRAAPMRAVLDVITREKSTAFIQGVLKVSEPEVAQQLQAALELPEELLDNYEITAAEATTQLRRRMQEALDIHAAQIKKRIVPVLLGVQGFTALAHISWESLVPPAEAVQNRIPLKAVRGELVELHRQLQWCRKFPIGEELVLAAEIASSRLGRPFTAPQDLWNHLDIADASVPFEDLIRIALEEPGAIVHPASHDAGQWWPALVEEYLHNLNGGPSLLRHRTFRLESLMREEFGVSAPPVTWLPVALYQRSAGALRRLALGADFRRTRVLAGSISREENLLSVINRKHLLDAHVALDQHIDELEMLIGTGDKRGKIGEEMNRLNDSTGDKSIIRVQLASLIGRHRPRVRVLLDDALTALGTIQTVCAEEYRPIARAMPQIGTVLAETLGNTSPVTVLDRIVQRYPLLVAVLQGLVTIEDEITSTPENR